jgi:DNA/RNA-binding protein KIN17
MGRAEKGTPKAISNQQKSKGLQRLRWYCQVCEKQCRDENGFKCHVQSEAHVRQMLLVGENAHRYVADFSRQFMSDFLQLLRSTHGEKRVNANHFYASQYISKKDHVHMNSTRWKTLTEFITFLGYEGICRVENTEKGWFVAWIDNSPEALKKRDANLKRERLEKGEADREDRLVREQIERARQEALEKQLDDAEVPSTEVNATEETVRPDEPTSSSSPTEEQKPFAPLTITFKKPMIATSHGTSSKNTNPLKPKKSDNPLKPSVKKDRKPEETNKNGKRPLSDAGDDGELRKRGADERRYHDDRHDRDRSHHSDRHRARPREVYVDKR